MVYIFVLSPHPYYFQAIIKFYLHVRFVFPQCDLILAIARLIEFYKHESCGQVSQETKFDSKDNVKVILRGFSTPFGIYINFSIIDYFFKMIFTYEAVYLDIGVHHY